MHGTTVLCVRRDNKVVIAGDGQVTMGEHVMKHTARKRRAPVQRQSAGGICRVDRGRALALRAV